MMKKFKQYIKEIKKNIKELKKTPRGNAILFFAFYFFFFLILMLLVRVNGTNTTTSSDYEKGRAYNFSTSDLMDNNYEYTYTVTLDNTKYTYTGTKNNINSLFSYNGFNYYSSGDNYFINNTIWTKCDNPILFSEFIMTDNISKIFNNMSYKSTTTYEDGTFSYEFLISTNTLNELLKGIISDYDEVPNEIIVGTNSEKSVNSIKYILDSYCKLNNLCTNSLELEVSYSRYGKIESIDNPTK